MANTTEILRIMRHAAERLSQEDPAEMVELAGSSYTSNRDMARVQARSAAIAMAYAASVLRLVAAVIEDNPEDGAR